MPQNGPNTPQNEPNKDPGRSDNDLTLNVFAPKAVEPKVFTWKKTMKVGEAADQAAQAFGYTAGAYTLQLGTTHEVLDRNRTLVSYGLKDGDSLEIVSTGGGV